MITNTKQLGRWLAIAMAIGLLCFSEANAKKPVKPPPDDDDAGYDLVVLAPPDVQITGSYAYDLNEAGNVVGYYLDLDDEPHGFYYDRQLGSFRCFEQGVVIFGLNNLGEMVGADWGTGEGLYWSTPNATPVPLPILDGHSSSGGFRINDAGIIAGWSQGNGPSVAAVWIVNAEGVISDPVELPFPAGDTRGSVSDLGEGDADGISQIVGYSGAVDFYETALHWEVAVDPDGLLLLSGPTDLGSLDGGLSAAYGVNSDGDVVGKSSSWPFVKPAGQSMHPLPGIQKATTGLASGINDLGRMVGRQGYLFKGEAIFKAVLWPDADSVIDLNKEVTLARDEELESAQVINNAGHILASAFLPIVTEEGNVACLLIPK